MNTHPQYQRALLPATGNLLNLIALIFQLVPKNLLSLLTGWLVRLRLPGPMAQYTVGTFARLFHLDMSEAELPIEQYNTIEELFTRRLKDNVRPLQGPLVSPADGYLAMSMACESAGTAIQAKGLTYPLSELIGVEAISKVPLLAWYQTIYLAPHNYHRVHAPFSGKVNEIKYFPGNLWPVNLPFVLRIPKLFCRNERLVFACELATGGKAWVVMVGALNVGRMVTPLKPDLVTNSLARQLSPNPLSVPVNFDLALGSEIGTFMLGSTVIIVYDADALAGLGGPDLIVKSQDNKPIKMGQSLMRGAND